MTRYLLLSMCLLGCASAEPVRCDSPVFRCGDREITREQLAAEARCPSIVCADGRAACDDGPGVVCAGDPAPCEGAPDRPVDELLCVNGAPSRR